VADLLAEELEFRGINRKSLCLYFIELGGTQITESFPYIFNGKEWSGQILAENELSITSTFKVNSIKVRFMAENREILDELIKKYRYKTTRIGG
jgi:hypothetical protein